MSRWPEDHPGRICAKCGENVYWLWADPVYPPPGTCMFKAPHAKFCENFRARCINHLQIARATDKAPSKEFMARLERAGVELDDAIKWRDDFVAQQDTKDREFWSKLGIDITKLVPFPANGGQGG